MLTKTPGDFEARTVASNEKRRVQGLTRSGGGVQFLLALSLNNYFQHPPPPTHIVPSAVRKLFRFFQMVWLSEER